MADTKISALTAASTPLAGTEVLPIVQSGATVKVAVSDLTAGRAMAALSLTTATVQATNSGGLALKNSGGTTQMTLGSGAGDNITLSVATNITPANAAVAISPTGTGTVAISPAGALTINPTTASTINNTSIGATTALTGRFTSVTATTGSFVVGTSGQGVDFAATPGTGTSELLDDYEEGTWTPIVTDGTNDVSMAANSGWYIKIGKIVTVGWSAYYLGVSTITVGAQIRIKSLPFTSASKDSWSSANFPYDSVGKNYGQRVPASGTQIYFTVTQASAGDFADLTRTTMGAATSITFFGSMTYYSA
jgi:hypothetical protein